MASTAHLTKATFEPFEVESRYPEQPQQLSVLDRVLQGIGVNSGNKIYFRAGILIGVIIVIFIVICVVRTHSRRKSIYGDIDAHAFDWDDNVMHMPTKVFMVHNGMNISVSTEDFAKLQGVEGYSLAGGTHTEAMREMKDTDDPDIFPKHAKQAAAKKAFAPAFGAWKTLVLQARPWSIITARSHSASNLRRGIKVVILAVLSDKQRFEMIEQARDRYFGLLKTAGSFDDDDKTLDFYLTDICNFYGVTGHGFRAGMTAWTPSQKIDKKLDYMNNPHDGKLVAFHHFTEALIKLFGRNSKMKIAFSDDLPKNVVHMAAFMKDVMSKSFPDITFVVFSSVGGSFTLNTTVTPNSS